MATPFMQQNQQLGSLRDNSPPPTHNQHGHNTRKDKCHHVSRTWHQRRCNIPPRGTAQDGHPKDKESDLPNLESQHRMPHLFVGSHSRSPRVMEDCKKAPYLNGRQRHMIEQMCGKTPHPLLHSWSVWITKHKVGDCQPQAMGVILE